MRYDNTVIYVIAGLLLLGCVPSIHPLFTSDNVVFDPALVGLWQSEKGPETMRFTRADEDAYQMVYTDKEGNTGTFEVHLTEIDGHRFLDFFPEDDDLPENDLYKMHLVPAHTFFLLRNVSRHQMQLSVVNIKWVGDYLKENPEALKHEWAGDNRPLLTASTEDLRKFFVSHIQTPNAYADPSTFKRVEKPTPPGPPATEAGQPKAEAEPPTTEAKRPAKETEAPK